MSEPAHSAQTEPEHKIGLVACLAFGTMVGGGVFTLSGTAIDDAGPAALLSYAIAGPSVGRLTRRSMSWRDA